MFSIISRARILQIATVYGVNAPGYDCLVNHIVVTSVLASFAAKA